MKFPLTFVAVLALHVGVIGTILVQPGCKSTSSASKEDTAVSAVGTSDISGKPIHSDFNAGMTTSAAPVGTKVLPTRPTWDLTVPAASGKPSEEVFYVVQKGDSLWSIAKRYSIAVDALANANELSSKAVLRAGQRLVIPVSAKEVPPCSKEVSKEAPKKGISYKVLPGETLGEIARKYHVSVDQIMKNNGISDPRRLLAGQIIYIEALPETPVSSKKDTPPILRKPTVIQAEEVVVEKPLSTKEEESVIFENIDDIPVVEIKEK